MKFNSGRVLMVGQVKREKRTNHSSILKGLGLLGLPVENDLLAVTSVQMMGLN